MKKLLAISSLILLAGLFLHACGIIPNANTSFVTITIGDSQRATLHAENATTWSRFKYFLADAKLMPEAHAYIPSVVQVIIVTVTAADITTPIVVIDDVSKKTSTTIRIEVQNGAARMFTIEGIHGATSLVTYRASIDATLDGTEITLPITMQFNYYGSAIFVDSALGNDTIYSGLTYSRPFKTITRALSLQSSSVPYNTIPVIWVEQGDYLPVGAGGSETFPLQMNSSTALICGGTGFTSVIGAIGTGTKIRGNDGASIDRCKIVVNANNSIGVDDSRGGGPAPVPTATKINGSLIEISGGVSTDTMRGVIFAGDSTMIESTITGTSLGAITVTGILINGGTSTISGSKVSALPTGIDLTSGAGDVVITNTLLDSNSTGINITTSNSPKINLNSIRFGSTGIRVSAGSPQITSNSIDHNAVGVDVELPSVTPIIQSNTLFCNTVADLFTNTTSTLDIRNNAWDHDSSTTPSGPIEMVSFNGPFGCSAGADVCFQGAKPQYLPSNAAVVGGCLIVGKPLLQ